MVGFSISTGWDYSTFIKPNNWITKFTLQLFVLFVAFEVHLFCSLHKKSELGQLFSVFQFTKSSDIKFSNQIAVPPLPLPLELPQVMSKCLYFCCIVVHWEDCMSTKWRAFFDNIMSQSELSRFCFYFQLCKLNLSKWAHKILFLFSAI